MEKSSLSTGIPRIPWWEGLVCKLLGSQLCSAEKPNFANLFFDSFNFSSKNFEFPFSSNIAVKMKVHEKANIFTVAFF